MGRLCRCLLSIRLSVLVYRVHGNYGFGCRAMLETGGTLPQNYSDFDFVFVGQFQLKAHYLVTISKVTLDFTSLLKNGSLGNENGCWLNFRV